MKGYGKEYVSLHFFNKERRIRYGTTYKRKAESLKGRNHFFFKNRLAKYFRIGSSYSFKHR